MAKMQLGNIIGQKKGRRVMLISSLSMEQYTLKIVNNCLNTNIYSYLETSGGQSSNVYLNAVHFFNTRVNYMSVAA
jgi:hypothetical protein